MTKAEDTNTNTVSSFFFHERLVYQWSSSCSIPLSQAPAVMLLLVELDSSWVDDRFFFLLPPPVALVLPLVGPSRLYSTGYNSCCSILLLFCLLRLHLETMLSFIELDLGLALLLL